MANRNLIRFEWAIKRLLRDEADFSVLEGFLAELLKEDILIESILESESNQLNESDKYNRVYILVKNSKGELVIIEIQSQTEYDYFQRTIYGVAKAITEYISLGEQYRNVKKIYSINIVYFDLGQGADYVYHGQTEFKGIHKADTLELSPKQTELLGGKTSPSELFPEYYLIKVNQFDDVAKDTLDQWIYYFKNNEIKDEFNAKGIHQARERWRVDTLPTEEKQRYEWHLKNLRNEASRLYSLKVDAEDRVRKDEKTQIAKALKKNGVDAETIVEATGLLFEDIENL